MTISVRRLSDDSTEKFSLITPETKVKTLKFIVKQLFPPANNGACVLIFDGKILESRRLLKDYEIINGQIIIMDDTENFIGQKENSDSDSDNNSE